MKNSEIIKEISEVAPSISALGEEQLYTVPTGYFTNLPTIILDKINTGSEPKYNFGEKASFSVPEGYFEGLSSQILNRVFQQQNKQNEIEQELNEVAPFLNTISRKEVYTVPSGYFERLNPLPAVNNKAAAKVVFLPFRKAIRFAVAAVIIGILAIGIFLLTGKDDTRNLVSTEKTQPAVKTLNDDEIIEFLKNTTGNDVTQNTLGSNSQAAGMNTSIKEMSDQEIKEFLEEYGEQENI